jgi:hypothetical protein
MQLPCNSLRVYGNSYPFRNRHLRLLASLGHKVFNNELTEFQLILLSFDSYT